MSHMKETLVIPIDNISQIVIVYHKNYALEGFLIGIVIDVIILWSMYSSGFGSFNMQY